MSVSPQVLPGRGFQQTTPNSNLFFHWRSQDRSLTTVDRSSTGTLTRASAGGLTDGRGQRTANALTDVRLVGPAADNQPRWGVSTARVPHLLIEDTRRNFLSVSTPTTGWQVSSALSTGSETTIGPDGLAVRLLKDNSTAAVEQMIQDVEVASTVSVLSWYTKWNGSTFGAIHALRLRGTADRGRVLWQFGSTGAMSITSTAAGKILTGPTHIGNNWWKTTLECTAISTAEDNQVEILPTGFTAGTTGGGMFIGDIQVEDVASTGLFATSHIPTAGAAATRAAEILSWPFLSVPQAMTVYCRFEERGAFLDGGSLRIWSIGGSANARLTMHSASASARYRVFHVNSTLVAAQVPSGNPALGDDVELRAVLAMDGSVLIGQSLNSGAESISAASMTQTLASSWNAQTFHLGSDGTGEAFAGFREVKIMAGVKTMAQCRESF